MAYITNYNFNRITKGFEVPNYKDYKFDDPIIWTAPNGKTINQSKPTPLFARWEVNDLLVYKSFCKSTAKAIYKYHRIEKPQDSYRYVQPEKSPSYHDNPDCERLHAEFERIKIPDEIYNQGEEKIKEFRKWWMDNESLRLTKPDAFVFKLNFTFRTHVHDFEVETKNNSGVKEFDNVTVEIINDNIYHQLSDLFSWAKENKKREDIFIRFAYLSYLGDTNKRIMNNRMSYSETEIKDVLKYIHPRKMGIIKDLKDLYLKTYNPKLEVESKLLDELGFTPCRMCCDEVHSFGGESFKTYY